MRAFVNSLYYVPIRQVSNVQALLNKLTVRYVKSEDIDVEDDFAEEQTPDPENLELQCFDTSLPGYIGVPRKFGIETFGAKGFEDQTTRRLRMPFLFPRTIKPRDKDQALFWSQLAYACKGPRPLDIVANAMTGSGKTETALWLQQNVFQCPMLVTVPTNKLRRQWRERIALRFGEEWAKKYVGHIQQGKMDYRGRLIVLGLAPSLARRDYPADLRNYFGVIWFDEFHKIGAPKLSQILNKYPASIRIGATATNRRDALLRVLTLHMGKPKIVSAQVVERPIVYTVPFTTIIPRGMPINSEHALRHAIGRSRERNGFLAQLIFQQGYCRDRNVLFLSDSTDQLQNIIGRLHALGVPSEDVGMIVGKYYTGKWRTNRNGKRVKEQIKMSELEQDWVAANCKLVGATYGIFDTGADVARLDMGVECMPRVNVRQAMGRIARPMPGKPQIEWYSIFDTVLMWNEERASFGSFADPSMPDYIPVQSIEQDNQARMSSFRDQKAIDIQEFRLRG